MGAEEVVGVGDAGDAEQFDDGSAGQRQHRVGGAVAVDVGFLNAGDGRAVGQREAVRADDEVGDPVGAARGAEHEQIVSGSAGEDVVVRSADEGVVAVAAGEGVAPGAAVQQIAGGVAGHGVVQFGADHRLDAADRLGGPVGIGESPSGEIDGDPREVYDDVAERDGDGMNEG